MSEASFAGDRSVLFPEADLSLLAHLTCAIRIVAIKSYDALRGEKSFWLRPEAALCTLIFALL